MLRSRIKRKIYRNANVFLNNAICHLNKGLDSYSNLVLTVVSVQMALELAIKYRIIEDYDVKAILENVDPDTDDATIAECYEANTLRVKEFESLKNFLKSKREYSTALSDEFRYMERFQKYRNKLVHFDYNFSLEEHGQLEADIIHIIVHILHVLMSTPVSRDEYREFMFESVSQDEYAVLLENELFKKALSEMITSEYGNTYYCPMCGRDLLTPVKRCLGCLCDLNDSHVFGFVECGHCGSETVVFDALNIDHNESMLGLCLNCRKYTKIYQCKRCGRIANLENVNEISCVPGYCINED